MFRLALLALLAGCAASPNEVAQRAAAGIGEVIEADGRGGAAVGIFWGEGMAVTRGYGVADIDTGAPVTPEHVFRIGSITKPVTAMAMLRLAHRGHADLGDPVAGLVPELARVAGFEPPGPSLIQLGTMTAGLAREPENLPVYLEGAPGQWRDTAMRALGETSFEYPPGTRYQYSNIGYAVLGAAVERAAGEPFMEHVRRELLAPLGMDSTFFRPVPEIAARIAAGYTVGDDGALDGATPLAEHRGRGYKVPNGALYSTVRDLDRLLRFLAAVDERDQVLPAAVRSRNLEYAASAGDLDSGYGFGFMARRLADANGAGFTAWGHGGGVAGYRAAAWIEAETGAAVVVLRNVGGGPSPGELALGALAEMVGALRDQPSR